MKLKALLLILLLAGELRLLQPVSLETNGYTPLIAYNQSNLLCASDLDTDSIHQRLHGGTSFLAAFLSVLLAALVKSAQLNEPAPRVLQRIVWRHWCTIWDRIPEYYCVQFISVMTRATYTWHLCRMRVTHTLDRLQQNIDTLSRLVNHQNHSANHLEEETQAHIISSHAAREKKVNKQERSTFKSLFVCLPSGKMLCLALVQKCTLAKLKHNIFAATGIPPEHQRLCYEGKPIYRSPHLQIIPSGGNIVLHLDMKGGANECDICYDSGELVCDDCQKTLCMDCSTRIHKHPSRAKHAPSSLSSTIPVLREQNEESGIAMEDSGDEYDIADSPNTSSAFMEASLIMTLTQKFNITRFKSFQKSVITATLSGKDSLIVEPTGSGKSLCFQLPPVHDNKKAVIITPTISLMQDHVLNAEEKGLKAVYLGSAQLDCGAESRAFSPDGKEDLIFVTPEWMSKSQNIDKVQWLVQQNKLSLITLDEAHLFYYWQEFRPAYKNMENLQHVFPNTPIMCLTATAPLDVEAALRRLLRNPLVTKSSVQRENIVLSCEEIPTSVKRKDFSYFASRVADILPPPQCAIIYTDFIEDVGPIMSELESRGIQSVAYYGEMDMKSRKESYSRWRNDEVNVVVATSAFGMGINKPDIRYIFRYGVPENIASWAQELGRAGRDGLPANAMIFYSQGNIEHAGAWIKGHLNNPIHCRRILKDFSQAWRYVMCNLASKCRRTMLLELFGEIPTSFSSEVVAQNPSCCDVCTAKLQNTHHVHNLTEELSILLNAIHTIGSKGEVKLAQWIRGSSLAWTDEYDKREISFRNSKGHSETWWRQFIRQCHVLGLVNKELKSIIKQSKHYSIQGIVAATDEGLRYTEDGQKLSIVLGPKEINDSSTAPTQNITTNSGAREHPPQRVRKGKGTHSCIIVRKLIEDRDNWKNIECKSNYQFPGVFDAPGSNTVFFTEDCKNLPQSCTDNPHYIWDDIQISKGSWNKDREIDVNINGYKETLFYRVASCNGVKLCPARDCDYIAPMSAQRACRAHPEHKLIKSSATQLCPVQFAYLYPKRFASDHRRWLIVFSTVGDHAFSNSLHNHPVHSSSKVCSKVKEVITQAAMVNPTLKPSEVARGQGLPLIPGAIDAASTHLGRISRIVKKGKQLSAAGPGWSICDFEEVADKVDSSDISNSGDVTHQKKLKALSRPYLISAGVENGIKFIFCKNPLMKCLLADAEFIETDITYNETREYPYLFNAVAFDHNTMQWVVVSRVRMDKQNADAYQLAFTKTFTSCKAKHPKFEVGTTLHGVVVDWSDSEIKGPRNAVGEETAFKLLKGCSVHWTRSWQRVRDRVCKSAERSKEKEIFGQIASQIQTVAAGTLGLCFEVLSGVKPSTNLVGRIKNFSKEDALFIDQKCDWSLAKYWAQWWMKPSHVQMLHKDYSHMDSSIWDQCPSDTNAVERKNQESKTGIPQILQVAVVGLYKLDKAVCAKYIAAQNGLSVAYRDTSEEARRAAAIKRQQQRSGPSKNYDVSSNHGPPDRSCHFQIDSTSQAGETVKKSRKRSARDHGQTVGSAKRRKGCTEDNTEDEELKGSTYGPLNCELLEKKTKNEIHHGRHQRGTLV